MSASKRQTNRQPAIVSNSVVQWGAAALVLSMSTVDAATISVDGTDCTLADAIVAANSDSAQGGCTAGSGTDTLKLMAATYTFGAVDNNTDGPNGLPSITSVIAINGKAGGSAIMRSTATGTPEFRLLHVAPSGNLTLNRVTVRNGSLTGYGAGIYNAGGSITLNNSAISDNSAGHVTPNMVSLGSGGGIYNSGGSLAFNNSTLSGNRADAGFGGGIYNSKGNIIFNNSTASGNRAAHSTAHIFFHGFGGGGIYNAGGNVTLNNSTLSGNRAESGDGGGIANFGGSVILNNSTASGNRAGDIGGNFVIGGSGAGIYNAGGSITLNSSTVSSNYAVFGVGGLKSRVDYDGNPARLILVNSIIANSNGSDCDNGGEITFSGKNLIEDGSCDVAMHGGLNGDPKLGLLLDNGGPTKTHALHAGSIAIGAADDDATPLQYGDQRGAQRPQGIHRDLGAFEKIVTAEANVRPIIDYFDQQAYGGGLVGVGATVGEKTDSLKAVRNQLLLAGDQMKRGLNSGACRQLHRTLTRIDADQKLDRNDYVTGMAGDDLVAMVSDLRNDLVCL